MLRRLRDDSSDLAGGDEARHEHLEAVPNGVGCTEIRDTLSQQREADDVSPD